MSGENQIEEMAKIIAVARGYGCTEQDHCDMSCQVCKCGCIPHEDAQILYNAGYRKQEWISVEERLPELYTYVITYDTVSGDVQIDSVLSNGEFVIGYNVTHWMPLPEAPKMKGGAE